MQFCFANLLGGCPFVGRDDPARRYTTGVLRETLHLTLTRQ
jgi:hypothetical protein